MHAHGKALANASAPSIEPLLFNRFADWNQLVGQRVDCGFMQSTSWMEMRRKEGFDTLPIGVFQNGELVGGAILHYFSSGRDPGFVVIPEGPAIDWEEPSQSRFDLRQLLAIAKEWQPEAIGLRIEPHLPRPRPSVLRNWSRSPVDLTPTETLIVDLSLSDDELLAQMHSKWRYNIRVAQRSGITIRQSNALEDMPEFHRLFLGTATRQEFFAEPLAYFLNVGEAMLNSGEATLLFAEANGVALSAILLITFGVRATYLYGGSSTEDRAKMPSHQLHFEAMRIARFQGCREYDFFGYDPYGSSSHPYSGFSRFKRGFGGKPVQYIGAWDCLFYERVADRLASALEETLGNSRKTGRREKDKSRTTE